MIVLSSDFVQDDNSINDHNPTIYSVSQKKIPLRFSEIFSQTVGNF